jgi:hypothetical protein
MANYINHDLRVVDGRTLHLPAWKSGQEGESNLAIPDIRDVDTVQQYPIGTKLVDGERVFYYCESVGVTNADTGVENYYAQSVAYATIAAAAAVGDTTVVLDVATTDGRAKDGVIAVNQLAGGFLVIFGHDDDASCHRILSNTVVGSGGGEMTLTLQDEVNATLVADSDHGECMESFFGCVGDGSSATKPIVGIAQAIAASGSFLWVQTWGPCWIPPQGAVGDAGHDMQVVFRHDGSIDEHDYSDSNVTKQQHAGFVMAQANAGGQGAAFIMLQICP